MQYSSWLNNLYRLFARDIINGTTGYLHSGYEVRSTTEATFPYMGEYSGIHWVPPSLDLITLKPPTFSGLRESTRRWFIFRPCLCKSSLVVR